MIDDETRNAFETIYRNDSWTNGSGPGSAPSSTIEYRGFVERFIVENGVKTVTDLGCGDWQFSRLMDWSQVDYTGFDIVQSVIDANQRNHGAANIRFQRLSNIDELPGGDLLISKEVLQHLPNDVIADYLGHIASISLPCSPMRSSRWPRPTATSAPATGARCGSNAPRSRRGARMCSSIFRSSAAISGATASS